MPKPTTTVATEPADREEWTVAELLEVLIEMSDHGLAGAPLRIEANGTLFTVHQMAAHWDRDGERAVLEVYER